MAEPALETFRTRGQEETIMVKGNHDPTAAGRLFEEVDVLFPLERFDLGSQRHRQQI